MSFFQSAFRSKFGASSRKSKVSIATVTPQNDPKPMQSSLSEPVLDMNQSKDDDPLKTRQAAATDCNVVEPCAPSHPQRVLPSSQNRHHDKPIDDKWGVADDWQLDDNWNLSDDWHLQDHKPLEHEWTLEDKWQLEDLKPLEHEWTLEDKWQLDDHKPLEDQWVLEDRWKLGDRVDRYGPLCPAQGLAGNGTEGEGTREKL